MQTKIEYRVRPVVRYIVTRFVEQDELASEAENPKRSKSSEVLAECANENSAMFLAQRMGAMDKRSAAELGRDDDVLVNDEPPIY